MSDIETIVKCAKCGFEAMKKIAPMTNVSFEFLGKDFYLVCPVITDKLRQGALEGPLWTYCPNFRAAATKARPQAA